MRNLRRSLYLLPALLLALAFYQPTPAQDAEPAPEPALLTADEVGMWQAWIRADLKSCYAKALERMESPATGSTEFRIALSLQLRCADELSWYGALYGDLEGLLDVVEGTYKADLVRWEMAQCLKHLGRVAEVGAQLEPLGIMDQWWVCGPFSNDRGQGFEDVLEPELQPRLDHEYAGKEDQPVSFRKLPVKPLDGTVDLAAMLRPSDEATAYLMAAVWCEAEEPTAELRLACDHELKVLRLVPAAEDEPKLQGTPYTVGADHDFAFDQHRSRIEEVGFESPDGKEYILKEGLRAGWNVLAVKLDQNDGPWRFLARLTGMTGEWKFATSDQEMRDALAAKVTTAEPGFRFRPARGGGPLRPYLLDSILEFFVPGEDRTSSAARRTLNKALDQVADDDELKCVLSYLAAWANRSTARYSAGREENRRRELLKQCVELDPKAARALFELSQYYTTTFSNPALADEFATKAVKANPDWTEARIYASRVVLMKGLDIEVERELAKLLQEFPEDANVLRFSAYYAGLRRDYRLSNDLFEKALKSDFSDSYSRSRLLERATARGDMQAALKLATDVRKLDPFDTSAAFEMADMYINSEKYSLAERELTRALLIAPRDDELLEKLGQVYSAWGDASDGEQASERRARAIEFYTAALEANPKREDIERYLEFLEGEQPPFEAALQEDVTERIEAALKEEVNGDNPYEVVYRDEIVVVNQDGTTSQYIQEVYRITNDNGRNWLQRLSVPAYSDQQGRCVEARVYRADGDVEEGRRTRWAASFPPLEIGDVVQVRFRVTDRTQSFFGDFYGERKVMADYVPIKHMRLCWVLPQGRKFYAHYNGERAQTKLLDHNVWSFTENDIPRLEDEPLAPPPEQRARTVEVSTYENWKEFGRWYYNLIRKQLEPTPEMTAKVMEMIKGLNTEKDKARAVYNWVVTEVRYNADWHFGVHGYKPFSAGAVFARCIGDCKDKAILICAMLAIAGVDAYPVITKLDNFRGNEDITLPMPNHFNHAIAYIEYSDGTSQFVDGTATYNGIDELPSADRGANCIIVRPDGGERTQIPWGDPSGDLEKDEINAEFAPGGTLKLTVKRTAIGDSASGLRQRYEKEGDRKKQLEREWSEHFPGAKIGDIEVNDLSDIDLQPEISFKVELPNAYTRKDGNIEFRLALDPREWTQTSFASLTTRKTDLLTPAPFQRRSVVTYAMPAGYKAANLPKAVRELDDPHVRLVVDVTQGNAGLVVTRDYALLGGTVTAAEYPEFRRKLIAYDTAEAATIKLTK